MRRTKKKISFFNDKKEKLWGVLTLPKALDTSAKWPALIICHGFGQTKSQRKFVNLARALAKQGIASLGFDFSGHGQSEGSLEKLSIEKQAQELKAAYDKLLGDKRIDKNKIALLGHSLGALVVCLSQAKYQIAKALVLLSPALHQKELVKQWYSKEEIGLWKKQGYLDTPKGRLDLNYLNEAVSRDWSEVIKDIDPPTLIAHGEKDKDIPLKYSRDLFEKLKVKKKLDIIAAADHHFESKEARQKLIELCLNWLKQNL